MTTILAIGTVLWILGLTIFIVLEKRSPASTLAWILALAVLPVVGIAVYFFFGPRRLLKRRGRRDLARYAVREGGAGEQSGVFHFEAPESPSHLQPLAEIAERLSEGRPVRARSLTLYHEGDDCYRALEQAIRAARHHVHLEYFIWEGDRTGTRLRDLLVERARDGVQVRLLLDSVGSRGMPRRFLEPLTEAGGEVAWFSHLKLAQLRPRFVNFRTHRKIVVCDGDVGFTGGMNVADYHSAAEVDDQAWRDTHLRIEGFPVRWLQIIFLEDWHFATGTAPESGEFFPESQNDGDTMVQVASSGPDQDSPAAHALFFTAISGARKRILIGTPYLVPDDSILTALRNASQRGVSVRILVPKKSDSPLVTAASRSYFDNLLSAGIDLFEYGPRMFHAKYLVVDDDLSLLGSANMDNRSLRLNFEILMAVYGEETATALADQFERDLEDAEQVGRQGNPRPHLLARTIQATARLFSPLL